MQAKDEEMIKFLDQDNEKQARRKRSIAARTYHSELHKTSVNGITIFTWYSCIYLLSVRIYILLLTDLVFDYILVLMK